MVQDCQRSAPLRGGRGETSRKTSSVVSGTGSGREGWSILLVRCSVLEGDGTGVRSSVNGGSVETEYRS